MVHPDRRQLDLGLILGHGRDVRQSDRVAALLAVLQHHSQNQRGQALLESLRAARQLQSAHGLRRVLDLPQRGLQLRARKHQADASPDSGHHHGLCVPGDLDMDQPQCLD